jgi:hypothetical protein
VVTVTVAGCGGGGKSAATTTSATTTRASGTTVTTHGRFHYPPSLIENFMRSCTAGNAGKQTFCACTLDRLSNHVSTEDFADIGRTGGKVPPRIERLIRRAAHACRR